MSESRVSRALDAALARQWLEPIMVGLLAIPVMAVHVTQPRLHLGGLVLDCVTLVAAALTGRWPSVAGVALTGLLAVHVAARGWPTMGEYSALVVVLCFGVRGRVFERRWFAAVYLVELGVLASVSLPRGVSPWPYALVWCALMGAVWLAGSAWRALIVAGEESARRAALEERHELARELHDSVADALASVLMRAEGAKLAGVIDSAELTAIADDAARAVTEFGHIVNVLRSRPDEPSTGETALDAQLATAEQRLRDHGFRPRVNWEGVPPVLPARVGHILGRVIEEATNNVIKHGDPGRDCAILVEVTSDMIELAILNYIRKGAGGARQTAGFGRVSMRERVEALNGTMSSEKTGETWLVNLQIPLLTPRQKPWP